MAGEDSEDQLTKGTNNQSEVPIEQPRQEDGAVQEAQQEQQRAQNDAANAAAATSSIRSISPDEKRQMMQRTSTEEWQQSRRDVASAAPRSELREGALTREESSGMFDFKGGRERWSPQISKSRVRQNKRLSPASVPQFGATPGFDKSQVELDELVGSGQAAYFRKPDQEQYIKRIDTRRATPSLTETKRQQLSEEKERATASLGAMNFFGGLTSKERSSKRKQNEAFGMSMNAPGAKKMYTDRRDALQKDLTFALGQMGDDWGKKESSMLAFGGFTTNFGQTKEERRNSAANIAASKKTKAEYASPYKPKTTSELDDLVSSGSANYIKRQERAEYKERKEGMISSLTSQIVNLEEKERSHKASQLEKKEWGQERAALAKERKKTVADSTMAATIESVIGQIKTDTSKKGLSAKKKDEIARTSIERAYAESPLLKATRVNMPTQMRKRGEGMFAGEISDMFGEEYAGSAEAHATSIGSKKYNPTSEPQGQTHGAGGKSAKKFESTYSVFGGSSTDPEIERRSRREHIEETYSNLVRAANEGDVKKYDMYKKSYREQLDKERDDKNYIRSRPNLPKITIKTGKPAPKTAEEIAADAKARGEKEILKRKAEREGRESKELELGLRIPIMRKGQQVGTQKISENLARIRRVGIEMASADKKDRAAAEAEEARLKKVGAAAPFLGGMPWGKSVALEPQVEEILSRKTSRKGGTTPTPVYNPIGEIVGVRSKAEEEDEKKHLLSAIAMRDELVERAKKKHATIVAKKTKEKAEEQSRLLGIAKGMTVGMGTAYAEKRDKAYLLGVAKEATLEHGTANAFRFEDTQIQKETARRTKYAKEAPIGKLMLSQALGTKPWNAPERDPSLGKSYFEQAWDDLQQGRRARANPKGRAPVGFLYGGGLQPVGVKPSNPYGDFPSVHAPRNVPNPLSRSEMKFFAPSRAAVKAPRTRRAAKKAAAVQRRKTAKRISSGGGDFFETLFW
jgi:hypothetical protein